MSCVSIVCLVCLFVCLFVWLHLRLAREKMWQIDLTVDDVASTPRNSGGFMRVIHVIPFIVGSLVSGLLSAALGQASEVFSLKDDIIKNDQPVKVTVDASGRYMLRPPLNGFTDPITPPTLPEIGKKGFDAKAMIAFTDAYVDAIEKHQDRKSVV